MENKNTSVMEKVFEVWEIIRLVCHFVPVITSIIWIIYFIFDPSNFVVNNILFPLMATGWISVLIACPLKFIKMVFSLTFGGLKLGWIICPIIPACFITAVIGLAIGLAASLFVIAYAPAVITIFCFVKHYVLD